MTEKDKKASAKRFAEAWATRGDEKQETQVFWLELLGQVFGVSEPTQLIQFEKRAIKVESEKCRVKSEGQENSPLLTPHSTPTTTGFIDAYLPATSVLIEQKSADIDLRKIQSSGVTPYQQARQYAAALPHSEHPRYIVTCNFREFLIYDQENPTAEPESILLKNLPKEYYRLAFLVEEKKELLRREEEVSVKAGVIVGRLYDALLREYENPESPATLHSLNVLCVRLVFCLYAEDAGIFPVRNQFADYIGRFPPCDVRRALLDLFRILDTPVAARDRYEDPALLAFPYVNGGLFSVKSGEREVKSGLRVESGELGVGSGAHSSLLTPHSSLNSSLPTPHSSLQIPQFTQEIVDILLHRASEDFDWSQISPTIFGAVFESTLNPETRRKGGMHYTSIENIHKVIDPLFLNDLKAELDKIKESKQPNVMRREASAFIEKISTLTFLDPACGSGNFLTEAYLSLRRLENEALRLTHQDERLLNLEGVIKVSINQFHGIEINDFAVTVAKTALWIAESQMLKETEAIIQATLDFLPLKSYTGIVEGNALRMDWGFPQRRKDAENPDNPENPCDINPCDENLCDENVVTRINGIKGIYDYIMGNPPFVGASMMTAEQKKEAVAIFGKIKLSNSIDYVGAWYHKAARMMQGTKTRAAFVSTNSITQGEQVAPLWGKLLNEYNVRIDFAHRTFRWDSEAHLKAHVHCVIIGFSCRGEILSHGFLGFSGLNEAVNPANPVNPCDENGVTRINGIKGILGKPKKIFDGDKVIPAVNINGYLLDAPDIFVESRSKPLCNVPKITKGCQPTDGGNLILSTEEREEVLKKEPNLAKFIKRYVGSEDLINDKVRWCFWLKDASPEELFGSRTLTERLRKVRELRLASTAKPTREKADCPHLFFSATQPECDYIMIPRVSSERRRYIPIAIMPPDIIASDACTITHDASLYMFGVLTSSAHNAWMRTVAGRLKSDYRYSGSVVYNTFPWPNPLNPQNPCDKNTHSADDRSVAPHLGEADRKPSPNPNPPNPKNPCDKNSSPCGAVAEPSDKSEFQKITQTAQAILDVRAQYPKSSLAALYDPLTMPQDLRRAHRENDRAVLAAYNLPPDIAEPALVAHLMSLYQKLTTHTAPFSSKICYH